MTGILVIMMIKVTYSERYVGLFLGPLFCSVGLCVCFQFCFALFYCGSVACLEVRSCNASGCALLLRIDLLFWVFWASICILGPFILVLKRMSSIF
jgi:hypothetical protein